MEGYIIWRWHLILPGCRWLLALRVGVYTPCGAMLTRGITVFVPGLLDLYMYARINDAGMGPYPPRVALALRTPVWSLHTVGSGIDRGTTVFVPGLLGM